MRPKFQSKALLMVAAAMLMVSMLPAAAFAETRIFEHPDGTYTCDIVGFNYNTDTFPYTAQDKNVYYSVTSGKCGDDVTWEFDKDSGTLYISGTGDMYDFVPYASTSRFNHAPWDGYYKKITSLVVADGVTSIGAYTAATYEELASVSLPDSVTTIGKGAFLACKSLVSVDIPKNVTTLGEISLRLCTSLKSVTLPDGLTTIENSTFSGDTSLTEVSIPSGVTTIKYCAFLDCSSLTSITIPSSVVKIEKAICGRCPLKEVHYGGTQAQAAAIDIDYSDEIYYDKDDAKASVNNDALKNATWYYEGKPEPSPDPSPTPEYSPFPDTPTAAWYHESVEYCKDNGIISGYDDGNFGPDDTLTRAQAAVILWNRFAPGEAVNYDKSIAGDSTGLSDLGNGLWYTAATNWAVRTGVFSGYDDGRFGPDDTLTREQLCAVVANASAVYGKSSKAADATELSKMPDASSVSGWATSSVTWALTNGVISGKESGDQRVIAPTDAVTRAEMAAIMMNGVEGGLL